MKPEEEVIIFEKIVAASAKRQAGQLKRLFERSKGALSGAGLHAEAEAVVNPLQAMLTLARVEQWDITRWWDEVRAFAITSTPEGGPERFDDAVRAAWQAAAQTFGATSLLSGLITAYGIEVTTGAASVVSSEPAQESAGTQQDEHRRAKPRPIGLKPLAPFRRRAPLDAQRSGRDDA